MKSIPSKEYTKKYFLTKCAGYDTFKKGTFIHNRLKDALNIYNIKKWDKVLDIGCSRGELLLQIIKNKGFAYGIDCSDTAIRISKSITKGKKNVTIKKADIKKIPFKSKMFDCVFLIDVVEHLYQWELIKGLNGIRRVLKNKGRIVIHTDNKLYKLFSENIIKSLFFLLGKYKKNEYEPLHVNYKTLRGLKKDLVKHGFSVKGFYTKFNEKVINYYIPFNNNKIKRIIISLVKIIEKTPLYALISPTMWVIGEKL